MVLSIKAISKCIDGTRVLSEVSLDVAKGQLVTLLGPSGCGKTTLLRIIAGLEAADQGEVWMDGQDTAQWDLAERRVGLVFQNYALFGQMSVEQNISFGLRVKPRRHRLKASEQRQVVAELLDLVQLSGYGQRFPHQLSGGQQQRVAIARALAIQPRLLLLDEPFGALDAKVRRELRQQLKDLQRKLGMACVLVTHDQDEARELSDHVILMNAGEVDQQGQPEHLFGQPRSAFARAFLGHNGSATVDLAAP